MGIADKYAFVLWLDLLYGNLLHSKIGKASIGRRPLNINTTQ